MGRLSVLHHGLGITPDLDAHIFDMGDNPGLVGQYLMMPGWTERAHQPSTGVIRGNLIWVARDITIDRIAIEIATQASAGGECYLGIYEVTSRTDLTPSALRTDYGVLATDGGTGITAITISPAASLPKGYYWFVITHNDVTIVVNCRCCDTTWSPLGIRLGFRMAYLYNQIYADHTYAVLPNTFPTSNQAYYSDKGNLVLPRVASLA